MIQMTFTAQQHSVFERLARELSFALKGLTAEELAAIVLRAAGAAGKETVTTKLRALADAGKTVSAAAARYAAGGIGNEFRKDSARAAGFIASMPERARSFRTAFMKLPRREQGETLAGAAVFILVFAASAGGADVEGGIPDADIRVTGIGSHRNIFSHTILVGLSIEFAARLAVNILDAARHRLPAGHHPAWDSIYGYLDKAKNISIPAMWLGLGAHLIKDSGIFTGGMKPYVGMPVEMPMSAHSAVFAGNGLLSGLFAKKGS